MSGDSESTNHKSPGLNARVPEVMVRSAQIGQLYSQVRIGMFAAIVAALALAAVLWQVVPRERILVWVVVFLAFQIPRLLLLRRFHRVEPQGADALPWGSWFLLGSGATSLLFGMSAVVIFPSSSFVHQCVLACFLGAFAASTAVAHAPLKECYVSSVLLTLLPLLGRFLYQGGESGTVLAAAGLAFAAALLGTGNSLHKMIVTSIRLRFQRDEMVRNLEQAHEMLENRVAERTAELASKNDELLKEVIERKRAEEALSVEKPRFQALAEHLPLGLVSISGEGAFQYINRKFRELFDYDLEDVPDGRHWFRAAYPDPEYRRHVISCWVGDLDKAKPGEQRPREFNVTCKDGSRKTVLFRSVQLTGGEHLMTCADVTEEKSAERALADHVSMMEAILEKAADGICVCYNIEEFPYVRFTHWNPRMTGITGYTMEEINQSGWYQTMYPDPDLRQEATERMSRMRVGDDIRAEEWLVSTKSGMERQLSISTSVIKQEDGRVYVLAIMQDITERKATEEALRESEKKYRTILETIADGYHEVDLAGNLTLVNDSMCEIVGYPREELLGVNYRKLMDEDNAKIVFEAYNTVYKTGKPNPGFNYQTLRKDGSRKDVSVSISPIKDADGKPRGFRGIFRDITERKRLQEQLYQAAKMEALGTLAGGIAHDFNNLLQILLGYSDLLLLRKNKKDADYAQLRAMHGAAQRGSDLVNRILTFSRKVETKRRPLDLNDELRQTERLLSRTIEKMISIEMDLADDLWTINADPIHIEQILLNLAVNAKHAMPEGGRLVIETKNIKLDEEYCRTHLEIKPGRYVLLIVSDTGHGMDKEVVERIFEPFFTTKEAGEGTGLGLATVFGMVGSHGGHINCYSEPGVGTTFKIHFPAIETELEWSAETTQEMPAFGTETILIVDDEESIRELAKELLNSVGYEVLTASNGREAIDIYSEARDVISLILLDLIMPEMDGTKCLQKLLQINPLVKVLVASGYSANGPAREAAAIGAKGYVSKPYDMRQLLRMVRGILDEV